MSHLVASHPYSYVYVRGPKHRNGCSDSSNVASCTLGMRTYVTNVYAWLSDDVFCF